MRSLTAHLLGRPAAGDTSGPGTPEAATPAGLAAWPLPAAVAEEEDAVSDADDAASVGTADSFEVGGANSAGASVFVLCNSAIGAGVLAMPLAFRRLGITGGLLACGSLAGAQGFTLYVLARFAEKHRAPTYATLVRRALGPRWADVLAAVLATYLAGSCAGYFVIVADCVTPLLAAHAPSSPPSRAAVVGVAASCFAFPLCLPRRLGALARVSAGAVAGFAFTAAAIVYRAASPPPAAWDHVTFGVRTDWGAVTALPLIVFALNCHPNVVSVFHELVEHPDLLGAAPGALMLAGRGRRRRRVSRSGDGGGGGGGGGGGAPGLGRVWSEGPDSPRPTPRSPRLLGMVAVIVAALVLIAVGYVAVGVAGYAKFPTSVQGNVLNSFPAGDPVISAARAVVGLIVLAHYPLNCFPARLGAEDVAHHIFGLPRFGAAASAAFTAAFVAATAAIALAVRDLSSVLAFVGGTAAPFIIFFLPGALLVNAALAKGPRRGGRRGRAAAAAAADGDGPPAPAPPASPASLIYSPRKSWWAGAACLSLAAGLWGVTAAGAVAAG